MATPTDQNFHDYKRAEKKALELLAAMKAATPKKVDIELALPGEGGETEVFFSDLTHEYVTINSEYST